VHPVDLVGEGADADRVVVGGFQFAEPAAHAVELL
jgi:hypothetical protein